MLEKNKEKLERKRKPIIPYTRKEPTKKELIKKHIEKHRGKYIEDQNN